MRAPRGPIRERSCAPRTTRSRALSIPESSRSFDTANASRRRSPEGDHVRNRLTRITTRGGDQGQSGLADGSRHPKDAPQFAALGDIDELNSALGVVVANLDGDAR